MAIREDVSAFVQTLKRSKQMKSSSQPITLGGKEYVLDSWKCEDYAYKRRDPPPTFARGLFTQRLADSSHRIMIRGYDKFFNVGELAWTKMDAIRAHSCAPYEVTMKENGCIIFVSAISSESLIVSSKHSLGAKQTGSTGTEGNVPHAVKGREWLAKHLRSVEKTEKELAQTLWEENITAVAELCDDSFEEHVLPYTLERSGLHLHGLNSNTIDFDTRPAAEVAVFATKWGFIPTRFFTFDTLDSVDAFAKEVGETGAYEGTPIEGFVVRTHRPTTPSSIEAAMASATLHAAPPYAPGQPWFFKIKYEQPYLMYREWRELARAMLRKSSHPGAQKTRGGKPEPELLTPRSGLPESKVFVHWCALAIKEDKSLFKDLPNGRGVFTVRNAFLKYLQTDDGKAELEKARG